MSSDRSLRNWYLENNHYPSHQCNGNVITDDESLGLSTGDGRGGYRSQDTIHYSSHNIGFYHIGDQSGDYGIGGYRFQETIHYYY